jgi:hypothetical protein
MSIEEEAMRWAYALSLRPFLFALDVVLAVLLIVFLVVAWRLRRALVSRRFDTNPSRVRALRSATRLDGAPVLGDTGIVGRPNHAPAARGLVAGHQPPTAFRVSGPRSSTGT